MKFPHADLKFTIDTLKVFSRDVAAARSIPLESPNFWRTLRNAAYDDAIIKWCVLFGSDNAANQPLHWKNMIKDHDAFRDGLLAACGIDRAAWDAYATEMRTYRDQLCAHHDLDPKPLRHPALEIALSAASYYFEQLRPRLQALGARDGDFSLAHEHAKEAAEFEKEAAVAIEASKAA